MPEKVIKCDCGKTVRGTEEQLIAQVEKHAKEVHNMELSREQILAMAQPV